SATRRPIDDLPEPIMPTSTIERRPRAVVTAASGRAARSGVAPCGIVLQSYWACSGTDETRLSSNTPLASAFVAHGDRLLTILGAVSRSISRKRSLPCPSFSILLCKVSGRDITMPSLLRFLTLIGILGGLAYGAMFMLATWFDPKPREITVSIPPDKFAK